MSYEMKDILKTMIDNNEPYWSSDTMDMVRVEIHNVYAQAAKVDEYEAKAEALDAIMREWENERMTKSHILETIQMYYNKYESGELDA